MCRREALKMRQHPRSASGAEARSIVDDLNGTSELVPFPSPDLTRRRNLGAGGPAFRVFPFRSGTVGAPFLRCLQGRVAMQPIQLFAPSAQGALRMRSWFPPFANCAKDGAPTCVCHASKIESPGQPPDLPQALKRVQLLTT